MNKKGQSISINTIIIAAIALAVLVVLFAIFTGRLNLFSIGIQQTDTCQQKCSSLNMRFDGTAANPDGTCSTSDAQRTLTLTYVAGKYKGAENGCCCSNQ